MNNMYDILEKINLLESKGSKPDFLDLDGDGNRSEPMKTAAKEVEEGSTGDYSAKKASAGKDIGKPGKQFSKIAADAAKRYGSKERGEKVAGAVLAKLRKEGVGEDDDIQKPRHPQELDYQEGPEDDEQYRQHHGLDDPDRQRERRLRATDYKTLDRLERQAVDRAKQIGEEDIDEVSRSEYIQQQDAKAERQGKKQFQAFGQKFSTDDVKESRRSALRLIKEHAVNDRSVKIYHDSEYDEFTVCLYHDQDQQKIFAEDRAQAIQLAKNWLSEGRNDPSPLDDPLTRFRKKHAPSVMKDPSGRAELAKLDVEYGERKKTGYGRGEEEDEDDEDGSKKKAKSTGEKRGRGRPKGTRRAIGAKGPTGRSKLLTRKEGVEEDYDRDEYDEEGEMAKTDARTIEDAAEELQSILDDQENLPEWVQKKISLAKDYVDRARDYMKANRPEGDEMMAEKAVSKAQRKAAGIAYAAKKGDIPKSELRGASKEMAKMASGELKKFAKTKEKDLPAKKTEEVEETTTAGNVAPGGDAPAKGGKKGGMQFGKGVYEARLAEQFQKAMQSMVAENLDVSVNANADGTNTVSVTGKNVEPDVLLDLLTMAGMSGQRQEVYMPVDSEPSQDDMSDMLNALDSLAKTEQPDTDEPLEVPESDMCEVCGAHEGMHEAGCARSMAMEQDLANSADNTTMMDTDYMTQELAGGLNGPKLQSNPNNMGDNPLAMKNLGTKASPNLNLGAVAEEIQQERENYLTDLYKRITE